MTVAQSTRRARIGLLRSGFLPLSFFRHNPYGYCRAKHANAKNCADRVVKDSFHSGASRYGGRQGPEAAPGQHPVYMYVGLFYGNTSQQQRTFWIKLGRAGDGTLGAHGIAHELVSTATGSYLGCKITKQAGLLRAIYLIGDQR